MTYTLSGEEEKNLEQYEKIGRSAGRLDQLFPEMPAWIRYGCLEPLSGGRTWCPDCKQL